MLFCMGNNEKHSKYCVFLKILSYIWQEMPDKAENILIWSITEKEWIGSEKGYVRCRGIFGVIY